MNSILHTNENPIRLPQDVLINAKAGKEEALTQLYNHYFERIYRFIYYRVSHKEVAEDLTEEVFIKLFRNLNTLQQTAAFEGWLYQIARNIVIDYYRSKKTVVPLEEVENTLEYETNIIDVVNLQSQQMLFVKLLKELTPEQQTVVKLKFLEDLDNYTIAQILQKNEGAIRVIQHRAIAKLKELISQHLAMTTPEHIFIEASNRLSQGEEILTITKSYPEHAAELADMLNVVQIAQSIPTITPPAPYKKFKFAQVRTLPYYLTQALQLFRTAAIPLGLLLVLLGGKFVVNAAQSSLPGDALYSLKRATEEARLSLTTDEEKVANLHVELAQRRLEEAKKVIGNNDTEQEAAAIVALQEQTEKTFAAAPQVAAVSAVAKKDSSLLENLITLNKEQKDLLTTIESQADTKAVTKTALTNNKANEETLAKLIATVNDQVLIDLPNKISVTGSPTGIKENKITVEKNTFTIDDETVITGQDGQKLESIPPHTSKITVIGTRSNQGVVAKRISIITIDTKPATNSPVVKGATTSKPNSAPKPTSSDTKPVEPEQKTEESSSPTNQASTGFIAEPSSEQYAP